MTQDEADEDWKCMYCGSGDPHNALVLNDEIEIDATCETVYIVPVDGGDGFAFSYEEFEQIADHVRAAQEGNNHHGR